MTNVKNIFMTNVNTNPHDNTQPDRTTTCDPTHDPAGCCRLGEGGLCPPQ